MCDSSNGLFWTLTPDGDVYPEFLQVPPATGLLWLNERHAPILTMMISTGRRLEQAYGLAAHRRFELSPEVIVRAVLGAQETEDTCREAAATATAPPGETPGLSELGPTTAPLSAPSDTPPGQGVSDGDPLALGDSMADPRCEERQHIHADQLQKPHTLTMT